MYQTATGAAVAIPERMDGLQLGMGNRGLCNDRDVVEVHKLYEIIQQLIYVRLGRRDERRVSGANPTTSDPVLLCTDDARITFFSRAVQQRLVDI